ncbi:MAG: efflux RND transporter periplasmic adaptor subunit [Clostridia bacterium]|nr:efflux RND transporter periplasmic adaptor subunit [Clostridia bacterium]
MKRRGTGLWVMGILVALILAGCGTAVKGGGVTASGTVEATEITVSSEMAGKITEVKVAEGDKIKAGEILAVLDDKVAAAQVKAAEAVVKGAQARLAETKEGSRVQQIRQAEAAVKQAQAVVQGAEETKNNAYRLWQDLQEVYGSEGVTEKELDAAETRYKTAESQLKAAAAQVKGAQEQLALLKAGASGNTIKAMDASLSQAEAGLEQARAQLAKTRITAPGEGTVAAVMVEKGELAMPGAPVLTLLDLQKKWVKVYVPEDQLGQIRYGQLALISVDSFPGETFQGKVSFIAKEAEFTPKNVQTKEERVNMVFAVKVTVEDPKDKLKPGLPADILFGEG